MLKKIALCTVALLVGVGLGVVAWLGERPLQYVPRHAQAGVGPRTGESDEASPSVESSSAAEEEPEPALAPEEAAALPRLTRVDSAPTPALTRTENYLLVGVDHTRGGGFGRTDTLIVAVFDDESEHVGLVSIPRDLHVEVPGHGPARINATLRIALRLETDPLELLREVVSDTLAMPIHHVVLGDLEAFEHTVDRLDGVDVDVPCAIIDNFIDTRTGDGRRILDVRPGRRHMDGATAAMYVRSRHGRSDWDRARRQQAVLLGLKARVRDLGPTEWVPVLSDALDEGVMTTMSRFEMIGLARRVAGLRPERMHGLLLGREETDAFRTVEGRSVLVPNFGAIDRALRGLFEAPSPGARPERAACAPADAAIR